MGNKDDMKLMIESGKTALGLEFGSTRIKAVLVDEEPVGEWNLDLFSG